MKTKQLFKIKYSDAFGICYFIMEAWDADSLKSLAFNYLGTNIKFLEDAKKATPKDIKGANHRGEYVRYYVIPITLV